MSDLSFFAELKRRNVLRVAAFYSGASWLLAQIATQVLPVFEVSPGAQRIILLLLVVGFPFALAFSWFYELTPQGLVRESEVDRSASITPATGKKLDRWIIGVLGLAVIVLLADKFILQKPAIVAAAPPAAETAELLVSAKSIAVLPFVNTSGDAGNEYFSDGLSEEMISSLSRLENLKVIGRTSSFQFKGKTEDSKAIGEKLGVVYLLEGSVRKSSDRVRIAVALVKSADGASIWTETYDREIKDIFAVQSEIAGAVATQLKVALLGNNAQAAQAPTAATPSNQNVEAYKALLQGNFYAERRTADDLLKAIGHYKEAIRLDPRYALAYARLAETETVFITVFASPEAKITKDKVASVRAASDTALALQPSLAEAHYARGVILQSLDFNFAATETEFRRAAELSPQNALIMSELGGHYGFIGRYEEALELIRRATVLDPLNASAHSSLATALSLLGRDDEAEIEIKKAIELQPQAAQRHGQLMNIQIRRGNTANALDLAKQETDPFWQTYTLALAYLARGEQTEADAQLKKLINEHANDGAYQIAIVYAQRKEPDKMFEWLDRAWLTRDPGVVTLLTSVTLRRYKDDPRFAAYCQKVGLPVPKA